MSQIDSAWGAVPSARYEALAARFRPIFAQIREGAVERELERRLPLQELQWLKEAGFTTLRVPKEYGGAGASLPELFNLLIELAEADSNLVQSLRGHFGFGENLLNSRDPEYKGVWLERLGRGETVSPASGEVGNAKQLEFGTRLSLHGGHWQLSGSKFYTTGALYADWVDVSANNPDEQRVSVTVRTNDPGVEIIDDWNGFGQTLTASGTAHFREVPVDPLNVILAENRFRYSPAFFQSVHTATLTGIGRALAEETAGHVARRTRSFSSGNAPRVAHDPQVLQVVGNLRSAAYAAGAIAAQNFQALERAHQAHLSDDELALSHAVNIAELEVAQSQTIVSDLIIKASGDLFDALSASATLKPLGLDRFWRNARTLSSHNPRIYKSRIVGDFAVNGTPPPAQWRIGVAE